jgi:Family of unknown function (DUF7003)
VRSVEVLEQLDAAAEEFLFPDLGHGYYYAVDARLHGYRDAGQWALIVETVGYSPRAGNLIDVLHVFANCLTSGEPGFDNGDFLDRVDNWDEIEDPDEPETHRGGPVVLRGQKSLLPPNQARTWSTCCVGSFRAIASFSWLTRGSCGAGSGSTYLRFCGWTSGTTPTWLAGHDQASLRRSARLPMS